MQHRRIRRVEAALPLTTALVVAVLLLLFSATAATNAEEFSVSSDGHTTIAQQQQQQDGLDELVQEKQEELVQPESEADDKTKNRLTVSQHAQAQIDWLVEQQGGYWNDKLEFRRVLINPDDPDNSDSYHGIFAKEDLPEGEVLLEIPRAALITHQDEDFDPTKKWEPPQEWDHWQEYWNVICGLSQRLYHELLLGGDSHYAPYVAYIQDQFLAPDKSIPLPSMWSEDGKMLLQKVIGWELPPQEITTWMEKYDDFCFQENDSEESAWLQWQALAVTVQRGFDRVLVPVYDMMNHDNGKKLNTDNTSVYGQNGFKVWASKAVKAGDELYLSYDQCPDCSYAASIWGTPELLKDFGFVEAYPQRWHFPQFELSFALNVVDAADVDLVDALDEEEEEFYSIEYLNDQVPKAEHVDAALAFFNSQLQRLENVWKHDLEHVELPNLPQQEYSVIVDYQYALRTALTVVAEDLVQQIQEGLKQKTLQEGGTGEEEEDEDFEEEDDDEEEDYEDEEEDYEDEEEGSDATEKSEYEAQPTAWSYSNSHGYADGKLVMSSDAALDEEELDDYFAWSTRNAWHHLDDLYRPIYQCQLTLVDGDQDYVLVDSFQSHYQQLAYFQDPKTRDTCFYLDGIYQMCGSYWPHYHEMVVHKTAKHLSEPPKRVLWVGGGDSGLLNEILKYPSLELAVGLELDQRVTRGAFKHFGMQPHYDNPKVQWWYGDASKSLLMLPAEYFGTFDMVLVDLSDTVLALSVLDGLDVIGALSLLLKPGAGVFEMNELFFYRVSNVFEHAIHYTYHDVPKVCDQSLVMASNDIEMLQTQLTNHEILGSDELLVENSVYETKHRYGYVHDYRHNVNATSKELLCDVKEKEEQTTSPGILFVIEAEHVTVTEQVEEALTQALKQGGVEVVTQARGMNGNEFTLLLQHGYVAVRAWPRAHYVALDLHLWSGIDLDIQAALVAGLGAAAKTSIYRIVAGGMFGTPTWREDDTKHGPQTNPRCSSNSEGKQETSGPSSPVEKTDRSLLESALIGQALQQLSLAIQASDKQNYTALALCGLDDDDCGMNHLLDKHDGVTHVLVVRPCSAAAAEVNCRDRVNHTLHEWRRQSVSSSATIDAILVDTTAPRDLAEMVHAILKETPDLLTAAVVNGVKAIKESLESKRLQAQQPIGNLLVVATRTTEEWRRSFVDSFRRPPHNGGPIGTGLYRDPVHRAEIAVVSSSSPNETLLELDILSSGDELFLEHLTDFAASGGSNSDVSLEIGLIMGGWWRPGQKLYMDTVEANRFVLPDEFPHARSAYQQWHEQQPVAFQSIMQFELQQDALRVGDRVIVDYYGTGEEFYKGYISKAYLHPRASKQLVRENPSAAMRYDIEYDDGEEGVGATAKMLRLEHAGMPEGSSLQKVMDNLQASLRSVIEDDFDLETEASIVDLTSSIQGDGGVVVAYWPQGSAVALWDGRVHVDLNLFTYDTDTSGLSSHKRFQYHLEHDLRMKIVLLDRQPRGYGGTVSYAWDLNQTATPADPAAEYGRNQTANATTREDPHWAVFDKA